ncbi:hypothetical protein G7Y89_g13643 [Cudoniella acicularis]|uniref:Uncharacterized protein n=1 Tax=Cudoniella acicularis TaxID=354080 RepID=A0A8H4R719_9HELO|nr:hypothetical protein G7Y89_g13643 [Cudoniella acicularis]
MTRKFAAKLLYKYKDTPARQVKLELDSLDLNNIYGIVFKFDPKEKCLVPYEFAEGLMFVSESGLVDNDFVDNLNNFINNFVNYVEKNNLTNIIRL